MNAKLRKFFCVAGLVSSIIPFGVSVSCQKMIVGEKPLFLKNIDYQSILAKVPKNLKGQGSSSVLPIIEGMKDALDNFQYDPTGSGDGFKVALGVIKKDFGMTSSIKAPSQEQLQIWKNNRIRTMTYASDSLAIVLNMPKELAVKFNNNHRPTLKAVELAKLFDKNVNNDAVTWSSLLNNPEAIGNQELVVPMGRIGGKSTSGTADGFFEGLARASGFTDEHFDLNHQFLPNNQQTAEAGTSAKIALEHMNSSLTYLSLGFALANESSNSRVADILTSKGELWEPQALNSTAISKTYGWNRPFNILYDSGNSDAVAFANFLLSPLVQHDVESLNFNALPESLVQETLATDLSLPDSKIHTDQEIVNGKIGWKLSGGLVWN